MEFDGDWDKVLLGVMKDGEPPPIPMAIWLGSFHSTSSTSWLPDCGWMICNDDDACDLLFLSLQGVCVLLLLLLLLLLLSLDDDAVLNCRFFFVPRSCCC